MKIGEILDLASLAFGEVLKQWQCKITRVNTVLATIPLVFADVVVLKLVGLEALSGTPSQRRWAWASADPT